MEATAMGNLSTQVLASGEFGSLAEMCELIRKSSDAGRFEPKHSAARPEGNERFGALRGRGAN